MDDFLYTTKPVTVEAFDSKLLDPNDTIKMPGWLVSAMIDGTIYAHGDIHHVKTRQGPVAMNKGDWLIRLDDGEIYPCSDEVFKKKYEKVAGVAAA